MPMYNLIEYGDNYSETSGTLWQYCRDKLALDDGDIVDFNAANATINSFKEKITGQTGNKDTKNAGIMVPLSN